MNVVLFISELFILTLAILFTYKTFKIEGLSIVVIIAIILSNIMMLKAIDMYNYSFYLGIVLNSTIFIIANIIIQKEGKSAAMRLLWLIWLTEIFSYILLLFTASLLGSNDIAGNYNLIFNHSFRLFAGSTMALIVSLLLDIKVFYFLRKEKNKIWFSNIISSIVVQFVEAVLFGVLCYISDLNMSNLFILIFLRYFLKLIICILGTPLVYKTNKVKEK